jgi:hypothetical protein
MPKQDNKTEIAEALVAPDLKGRNWRRSDEQIVACVEVTIGDERRRGSS